VSSAPEDKSDAPYAVLQDGRGVLASRYNVKRVPRLFLIENGEIRLVQNGFYPGNEQQLEEELAALLEEKAPRSANRE
jgi:protein-disulfide isomerase-like protein with CxxC motif